MGSGVIQPQGEKRLANPRNGRNPTAATDPPDTLQLVVNGVSAEPTGRATHSPRR